MILPLEVGVIESFVSSCDVFEFAPTEVEAGERLGLPRQTELLVIDTQFTRSSRAAEEISPGVQLGDEHFGSCFCGLGCERAELMLLIDRRCRHEST
jgi:hypothetical protein